MINRLNLNIAINSLSIGNCGFNILRELYRRKVQCSIFPKGQVQLEAYKVDPQFAAWIERSVNDRLKRFDRTVPTISCWHLAGSEFKPSDKQYLLTFHETDSPTEHEINISNQQAFTFFSSNWSVDNFKQYGATNVGFAPLGLDEDFTVIPHRQIRDEITHWGLVGKWEDLRKMTGFKIQAWIKKYGGNKRHQLTLCVVNPFFQPDQMNALLHNTFKGNKPFNVNVLPYLKTNVEMNQLYNSFDIDLSGYARNEGWNLPAFIATALGKWSIVTNCSAHKDWATNDNAILVEPTGVIKAVDNVFFAEGQPFNQGNMFDFGPDAFEAALEVAEKRAKTLNVEGRKLAETHTWTKTVDTILAKIEEN